MTGTEPTGSEKPEFVSSTPSLEVDPIDQATAASTAEPVAPGTAVPAPPAAEPMPKPLVKTEVPTITMQDAEEQTPTPAPTVEAKKPGLFGRLLDMISAKPEEVEKVEANQAKLGINTTGEHLVMDSAAMAAESKRLEDLRTLQANGAVRVTSDNKEKIGTGTIEPKAKDKV